MRRLLALIFGLAIAASACSGEADVGGSGITGSTGTGAADDESGLDNGASRGASASSGDAVGMSVDGSANETTGASAAPDSSSSTDADAEVIDLDSEDVRLTSRLVTLGGCDALIDHIRSEYARRVGPWGSANDWHRDGDDAADDAVVTAEASLDESSAPSFSGTNVQEVGADEADIVKTDGRRIFVISGGRLAVVDAASRAVTGSVELAEGSPAEMFVTGDSVLVLSQAGNYLGIPKPLAESLAESVGRGQIGSMTVIQRFDIRSGRPEAVSTARVEGAYLSSRSIDGVARVIIRFDPHWNFPFVYPATPAANGVAEEANRRAVLDSDLDDWLPFYAFDGGSAWSRLPDCDDVHVPPEFSGFGLTTVLSIPVDGAIDLSGTAATLLAPGDLMYASTTSLYAATVGWGPNVPFDMDEPLEDAATAEPVTRIHRFDITGQARARYIASGEVTGTVRDQFSLSEHDGHLRVVTTTGGWGDSSQSQVRVLLQRDDRLVEVGSVGDIGKGEQVQSVRFAGDVGYVVTFRRIDPFYTIDLSEPARPVIRGELKIPGFSSYLHPLGDGLVLGVGSDADDEGAVRGSKVSLFDVSDLSNPLEVDVWTAPGGWSDIGWDHRAFLWWAPESLAVVPVTLRNDNRAGAVLLRVVGGELVEAGWIDHMDTDSEPGQTDCRRLAESDLLSPESVSPDETWIIEEIRFVIAEGYEAVVACEPGERGVVGFDCVPSDLYFGSSTPDLVLLDGEERLTICYPGTRDEIVRAIVIDDGLWTLSYPWGDISGHRSGLLQLNDLGSFNRLASIGL